ncbi:MAG: hypothetical protein COW01_07775 [Bdellovibrionales bacterium CG12_big_fil_rev_8_21_14_0_65_38_15]|nr:MAG: hypothetical protein COW79_11015 [Bdellovibrionales bacterium CG22_combo_CG10-13_8_21_14_all_38_13]PIQ55268.1 MAG: hypothetical protein COW01_07775 [Bdellovibrionales bacterium CG12_big_fil_rev_8_21_14_0_65_38_15]PIR30772.1 MAG: hypothetical protein COV38_03580 [Bdellovibrionales bacterium CG11_big_fil_rev_8_21_14_0_20_38_13]
MLKNRSRLIFIFTFIFCLELQAYPLFYKCGAGDRLEDTFAGPEILNQVQAMLSTAVNEEDFKQQANALCRGANECLEEVERIKALIGQSKDITTELLNVTSRYNGEIRRSQEVDQNYYDSIKSVVDQAFTLHACQEIKRTWDVDSWVGEDKNNFAVFYPKYNNYMYATGCRGRSSSAICEPNKISNYKNKIKSALLMGMDPYLAISLVWMEGGTKEGLDYLYLDPIAKFGAMGCTGTSIRSSQASDNSLNSYGTFYEIEPKVITRPALTKKLIDFQKAKGKPTSAGGTSYFCRKIYDDLGIVYDEPQDESCCLKLPFTQDSADMELIEEALIFEQARKNYQRRFSDREDPAFRIQRFNGYSRLMGAAEEVDAFRSGVDHYEHPAYGYQAMDYMVNSILTNPVIRNLVEEAEAEVEVSLGKKSDWRSIMCVEHPGGGIFQTDSNYYFNLHRDTPRLALAYTKWEKGEELSNAESKIVEQDIKALISKNIMKEDEYNVEYSKMINNYFTNHYQNRSTVGSASVQQSTYTWENLSNNDLSSIGSRILNRD